jgi:UMF1 family MFS transporter
MFGFYMLSGKATAFFGPLIYGWVTYLTGSLRWGMSTIILLFILGGMIMLTLPRKLEYSSEIESN